MMAAGEGVAMPGEAGGSGHARSHPPLRSIHPHCSITCKHQQAGARTDADDDPDRSIGLLRSEHEKHMSKINAPAASVPACPID